MSSSSTSPDVPKRRLSTRELVLLALMGGIMMGGKLAMAAIPNVSPVALFIILSVLVFGVRAFYPVFVYITLEFLVYGFGLWSVSYLYAWPLLTAVCLLLRKNSSYLLWAIVAAVFGLCFGALCAIPYLFIGGWAMAFSYWVSGIPYDLLHCAGNLITVGLLLKPLHRLLLKLI